MYLWSFCYAITIILFGFPAAVNELSLKGKTLFSKAEWKEPSNKIAIGNHYHFTRLLCHGFKLQAMYRIKGAYHLRRHTVGKGALKLAF